MEGWKDEYESTFAAFADPFECVEVNRTFCALPEVSTGGAGAARSAVNPDFTFAVTALQAITHPVSSPTWRGHDDDLSETGREEVGMLQPNPTVIDAWKGTRARTESREADVVVIQSPHSFDCSGEHEQNLRGFVAAIDRGGVEIAWEPVATTDGAYTRLHGLNEDPYDYDSDYGDGELEELADRLVELAADHERVYCLFNNDEMDENARQLASALA